MGSRPGLEAWALWVLASAVGGAIAGSTFQFLEHLGVLFLPGLVVGVAQASVLPRPLGDDTAGLRVLWVLTSFFGWPIGWMAFVPANRLADRTEEAPTVFSLVGSVFAQLVDTEAAREQALMIVVWTVFAVSQGAALALAALVGWGRRSLLPSSALFTLAGIAGGASGLVTDLAISAQGRGGSGLGALLGPVASQLDPVMRQAAGEAAAWTLYGAATGVVLATIARRPISERDGGRGSGRRRDMGARVLLWAALGVAGVLSLMQYLNAPGPFGSGGCNAGELAALMELPRYDGGPHEPGSVGAGSRHCNSRYTVDAPREEVIAYYAEGLREDGWEVEPEGATMLTARRDGYRYRIQHDGRLGPLGEGDRTSREVVKDVVEVWVASEGRGP